MTATPAISRRAVVKSGAVLTTGALSGAWAGCSGTAAPAPEPITFVVAHGAWSSGWAWKRMHPLMTGRGHRLLTPSYTGLGERAHLARSEAFRPYAEQAAAAGWPVSEMDASHNPHITVPDELAGLLERIARESA